MWFLIECLALFEFPLFGIVFLICIPIVTTKNDSASVKSTFQKGVLFNGIATQKDINQLNLLANITDTSFEVIVIDSPDMKGTIVITDNTQYPFERAGNFFKGKKTVKFKSFKEVIAIEKEITATNVPEIQPLHLERSDYLFESSLLKDEFV